MWLILTLGCSSGDPEAVATRRAIQAYREGTDVLDSDPEQALRAFRDARVHRPEDPLLRAWEGMALARMGQLDAAVAVMDELIAADPRFAEARYNRAAWLARGGSPAAAAEELQRALRLGAARPREAMRDPDFAPHLELTAFDFLPAEMLAVSVEGPTQTAFWGSEVEVRFRVVGTAGEPVRIVPERAVGPLVPVSVREDHHSSADGRVGDVRFTFRVDGPGEVVLGPFRVHAGRWSTTVDAIRFTAEAPNGKRSAGQPPPFATPSDLRGEWGCAGKACGVPTEPVARRVGKHVDVLAGPDARIVGGGPSIRYQHATDGVSRWSLWRLPDPSGEPIVVREGRRVTTLRPPPR